MKRGLEMFQNGATVSENDDGSFAVASQTSTGVFYEVRVISEHFVCTCPDFEYRCFETCKHIELVKLHVGVHYIKGEPNPKVFADDAIPCDSCGSIRTIRYGMSANRQVFKCKYCAHKFRERSVLQKVKFNPEVITLTLDLYFSGLSLRKIARNLHDHFDIDIHFSTIYTWIERYVPIISEYVNTLTPQLSEKWHADEVFIKMRGSPHQGKFKGLAFLWNVMDSETRFLLASRVSEGREIVSAIKVFQEAIKNAHGQIPDKVYTDAYKAYRFGIKAAFEDEDKQPEHVAKCGLRKHDNNNRIERANGTLRERIKIQRGWKSYQTPLAEGKRIQYNFVKPHMALDGKTPAQKAGLQQKGWKELVEIAVSNRPEKLENS